MKTVTVRLVECGKNGSFRIREYQSPRRLQQTHTQIGIDDCSTDLSLRGLPVFRGLVGPIPDGDQAARYETPDVFESLTLKWGQPQSEGRRATRGSESPACIS